MKLLPFIWLGAETAKKPNVVLILTDDLGMGDISVNNKLGKIKTPNIDKLAKNGVNFLDAHSASSKCSPSRYMLMTGRYDFDNSRHPSKRRLDPGTPHMAEMFKKQGYITGIVGKSQPIYDKFEADDLTQENWNHIMQKTSNYNKALGGGTGERQKGESKASFYLPSNYSMAFGPHTAGYDYSFLNQYACCRVGGGYFENGVSIKPFTKYAIQRFYPETEDGSYCFYSYDGDRRCGRSLAKGYLAPPHFETQQVDGPVVIPNHPPSPLVQEDYDSREIEEVLRDAAVKFINENSSKKDPFFLYFGMRGGHNPFNTPERYRNTSDAGLVGEAIMEVDDIVGDVMSALENKGVIDDTLVVFMSDNGAINKHDAISAVREENGDFMWTAYRHYQNSIDIYGKNWKMRKGKGFAYEGGHRVPFIFHYPNGIKQPKVVDDTVVSYIDLYRTLGEVIGYKDKYKCTEAPDSVSLWPLITGNGSLSPWRTILHHSIFDGSIAVRQGDYKLIPANKELFNLREDMTEMTNLYEQRPDKVKFLQERLKRIKSRVDERNKRTKQGQLEEFC